MQIRQAGCEAEEHLKPVISFYNPPSIQTRPHTKKHSKTFRLSNDERYDQPVFYDINKQSRRHRQTQHTTQNTAAESLLRTVLCVSDVLKCHLWPLHLHLLITGYILRTFFVRDYALVHIRVSFGAACTYDGDKR